MLMLLVLGPHFKEEKAEMEVKAKPVMLIFCVIFGNSL